ncbi:WD40 repeat domain-containing protein [Rubrobacter indicoceani]|uniref:WD40 repeat domain-containing protein n=1 Tax=Rubrobacter indicoceani TaxID=2051957 RepID=UPI000E5A9EC1|nr:WD40 repeat domain-containing protein [Rubrobacter indicoceani]
MRRTQNGARRGAGRPRPKALDVLWRADAEGHVVDLSPSPDGRLFAAASVEGPVLLLEVKTGRTRHALPGHDFGALSVSWSRDGRLVASCGQDGHVRVWKVWDGEESAALAGGAAWVEKVAFSPDGRFIATAAGPVVRLWRVGDSELLWESEPHGSTVSDVAWRPGATGDQAELASASYGGISLFGVDSGAPRRRFEWQGSTLVIRWSPNGRFIATGDQDSTVHFWIHESGRDLQMHGYPTKVRELAWDPASRLLATGGGPTVTVWDCSGRGPAGTTPVSLSGAGEANVGALAFQRKGSLLASGTLDGEVSVWNPLLQPAPTALAHGDAAVSQLAWAMNDRILTAGFDTGTVVSYKL